MEYTDNKTGKQYDIQKNGNKFEMDIIKKGSSIYAKSITIKRSTLLELKNWLDGYNIESNWIKLT